MTYLVILAVLALVAILGGVFVVMDTVASNQHHKALAQWYASKGE